MPKYCQVPNCNQDNDEEVVYHQFPKDNQLKQKWLMTIGRPDYKPTSTSLICSKHFEETDFTYRFGKKTLRAGVTPSIFNSTKIKSDEEPQRPQPKEKTQKATRNKYSFYIPHYILVNKEFLNSGGLLNLESLSSHDNLSPPILYGIGNTSTVINSPDAITSPFLKRKKKEDNNSQRSKDDSQRSKSIAIKELAEIHSYTKKPDELIESGLALDNEGEMEVGEEEEEEDKRLQADVTSSNKVSQNPNQRSKLVRINDCSPETLRNPRTARVAWSIIQRTLDSQQRKIKSLQSEYVSLQTELQQLKSNIQKFKKPNLNIPLCY